MPSPLSLVRRFAYGLLMGGADIIPGVSGGTMALIVGVYERLVHAISTLVSFGLALVRFDPEAARGHWADVSWGLILPLGGGIGTAIVIGARVIPPLMEAYPAQMSGLFLGLVAASLVIPAMRMERFTATHGVLVAGFGIAAFLLTGLPMLETTAPGLVRVFFSAAVAICAMILPGISGAFLLKALGIYEPTLTALSTLQVGYVVTFCAGAAAGLGSFAKLLDWLLAHRHDATMAALIGLIAGALRALWPYTGPDRALQLPEAGDPVASVALLAVGGLLAVLGLIYWGQSRTPAHEPQP